MTVLAVIDATDIDAPAGPQTVVAGLSLVERAVRLADASGADEIVVLSATPPCCAHLVDATRLDASVRFAAPGDFLDASAVINTVVVIDAQAVFDRSFVHRTISEFGAFRNVDAARTADASLVIFRLRRSDRNRRWRHLFERRDSARPTLRSGWSIRVDSRQKLRDAERRIWNGCRKPEDGLVARFLNRHLSLAISRRLAPTDLRPNHVTALAFGLGVGAAICAVNGGYLGFLFAGILYQLNSVADGIDGELARARYEFSATGEWLDTLADDATDLLIYVGLGLGAWRTGVEAPGPCGESLWLLLGAIATIAKLATMFLYYRWLYRRGRGDLLAFDWNFTDRSPDTDVSSLGRILSALRYVFRKDFVVYVAMILALGGYLPHFLLALAPGNLIAAVSVAVQSHSRV